MKAHHKMALSGFLTSVEYRLLRWRASAMLLALFIVPVAAAISGCASKSTRPESELCPNFVIRGEIKPGLNEAERLLVCGNPNESDAWKTIPPNQAWFNLKNFLQERGFFRATFDKQGDRTIIDLGKPTYVTSLEAVDAPADLHLEHKRRVVGELLTPKLLGTVETWITQHLQGEGYACPKVLSEADPETGRVRVTIQSGPKTNLGAVIDTGIPGIEKGVPRRYDAFRVGDEYDGDLLALTETRMIGQNVVQSTHFVTMCEPGKDAVARQEFVAGPPRLLSFGFGTNTESALNLRAQWRNSRLGLMASWVEVVALASIKEQRLESTFNWYHLPYASRRSIRPYAMIRHRNESNFEDVTARGKFQEATTWDNPYVGLSLGAGPGIEQVHTQRGPGPVNSRFVTLDGDLMASTHDFEYQRNNPRSGASLSLNTSLASSAALSSASVQRVNFSGEALYNVLDYDPALFVLGARGGVGLTLSSESLETDSKLPIGFRQFLGGSADLRGFGRKELPDPDGASSEAFLNLEGRLADAHLPIPLQPFAFYDIGRLSKRSGNLGGTTYTCPGLGIRYPSPVGVIRTTFARGYAGGELANPFQFFFSFGEEF